ncbi:MAG: NAD-binding protein [Halobellus sp.]|uniref:NAD-binding protein n=1 Tax=Halobellus sp. TaxID=1979212 RepID=UPI0035D4F96A
MMNPTPSNGTDTADAAAATHYILGGDHVGVAIAERLRTEGQRVVIVDEPSPPEGIPGVTGDPAAAEVLAEAGIEDASTVIVATSRDRRNLLIAQLVRVRFDVQRVLALVNDPSRRTAFADAGHEPLCVTTVLSEAVGEVV